MIRSFRNAGTKDLFFEEESKAARSILPSILAVIAKRKLDQLNSATRLGDLRWMPGNRVERLHGARDGQYSIRINRQYRICFGWGGTGPYDVEVVDYH